MKRGDVYKRIDDTSYSDKVRFGVVVHLYNNGEKTYIEAIEYKVGYGDIDAERKVISGDADVSIFPATVGEVEEHFVNALNSIERKIVEKRDETARLERTLEMAKEFVSGELTKKLTEPEFEEMTQREYVVGKQMKELEKID